MPLIQVITNDDNRDLVASYEIHYDDLDSLSAQREFATAIWDEVREAHKIERSR